MAHQKQKSLRSKSDIEAGSTFLKMQLELQTVFFLKYIVPAKQIFPIKLHEWENLISSEAIQLYHYIPSIHLFS